MSKSYFLFYFFFFLSLNTAYASPPDTLVRLILYGGAREINAENKPHLLGIQHNNTFGNAAFRLKKEYLVNKPGNMKVKVVKVQTGEEVVFILNKQASNSIVSLDIITHSDMPSLNMSLQENTNCGIYTNKKGKWFVETIHKKGYHFTDESRSFSDIDYSRFSDTAKIEFHGCRTAGYEWFCKNTSHFVAEKLAEIGKNQALVIGHIGKSETLIRKNGENIADYRHKLRVIYQHGKIIQRTYQEGNINQAAILRRK